MARLVVLTEGFTGLSHELKAEKVSIGRVEDNSFQIAEPSVSSHHCEVLKRGNDFIVKDLNSTNGTFVDGEQVTEATLKPGHILRLGQVEVRLETGTQGPAPKPLEKTMVLPQGGVRLHELDQSGRSGVDPKAGFAPKSNKTNRIFIGIGIALGVIIIGLLVVVFLKMAGYL
jgi:pSer/pThr/pTyr-binding forkhead associated (FHA) protein